MLTDRKLMDMQKSQDEKNTENRRNTEKHYLIFTLTRHIFKIKEMKSKLKNETLLER